MIKNIHHLALIKIFQDNQNILDNNSWVQKYLGTDKRYYGLKTDLKVKKINEYFKKQKLSKKQFEELLLSLSRGNSFEELNAMSSVLGYFPNYRSNIPLSLVDKLFDHTVGWCEVDCTCCFSDSDLFIRWNEWEKLLKKFLIDKNIHKRRASIVILCKPLRLSDDSRLSELAFSFVDQLKFEKDILITKAISWVLRSAIKSHPDDVAVYLEDNQDTLPKIAYREATKKLTTGKKN
jgi:3-methyladenine DNA glycosylase AlkD